MAFGGKKGQQVSKSQDDGKVSVFSGGASRHDILSTTTTATVDHSRHRSTRGLGLSAVCPVQASQDKNQEEIKLKKRRKGEGQWGQETYGNTKDRDRIEQRGGKKCGGNEIVHKKRPWVMQKRGDKAGECWRISTRTKLGNVLLQQQLINSIRAKDKLWSCQVFFFFLGGSGGSEHSKKGSDYILLSRLIVTAHIRLEFSHYLRA